MRTYMSTYIAEKSPKTKTRMRNTPELQKINALPFCSLCSSASDASWGKPTPPEASTEGTCWSFCAYGAARVNESMRQENKYNTMMHGLPRKTGTNAGTMPFLLYAKQATKS